MPSVEVQLALLQQKVKQYLEMKERLLEQAKTMQATNDRLRHEIERRKQAESTLRYQANLLQQVSDSVIAIDSDEVIYSWNRAAERMYGWSAEEVIGKPLPGLLQTEFSEGSKVEALQALREQGHWRGEVVQRHRDGTPIHVASSVSVVLDTAGQASGLVAVNRDITERKQADLALQAKTEALARSNAELEQFGYIVSHDLKEPLRAVSSYAGLLKRRYGGELDDRADKYIGQIITGADRMRSLIDDLLKLARVDTAPSDFPPIPSETALQEAMKNLQLPIDETGAIIEYDSLPALRVDRTQLTQLFQNLIANALKFRGEAPPRVRVSARRVGAFWQVAVADNGIGLDLEQADRIFVIFQRLHTRREYEGNGLGLAICKKIVERYGGRIWVESKEGQGAAFYFTLP